MAGFGYDPIFQPLGHDRTFAQMTLAEKSVLSHRGLAMNQLMEWLRDHLK
jgi:XTP/dITP diphosphohydrolase